MYIVHNQSRVRAVHSKQRKGNAATLRGTKKLPATQQRSYLVLDVSVKPT